MKKKNGEAKSMCLGGKYIKGGHWCLFVMHLWGSLVTATVYKICMKTFETYLYIFLPLSHLQNFALDISSESVQSTKSQ